MDRDKLQSLRNEGALLAATATVAAVLMHHHPHGGDGAGIIRAVHGGLIALIVIQPVVFALIARAMGWRPLPTAALGFFAVGSLGAVLAGTVNGFMVPAMGSYPAAGIAPGIREMLWEMNQAFATIGAVAVGIGIALFGVSLWRAGWKTTGAAGIVAGAVSAGLVVTGVLTMQFFGAIVTYMTQLSWMIFFGVILFRAGRANPSIP